MSGRLEPFSYQTKSLTLFSYYMFRSEFKSRLNHVYIFLLLIKLNISDVEKLTLPFQKISDAVEIINSGRPADL